MSWGSRCRGSDLVCQFRHRYRLLSWANGLKLLVNRENGVTFKPGELPLMVWRRRREQQVLVLLGKRGWSWWRVNAGCAAVPGQVLPAHQSCTVSVDIAQPSRCLGK